MTCPPTEQIRAFATSGEDSPENEPLIDHFTRCPACQQVLDSLAPPPAARDPRTPSTVYPSDSALARVIIRGVRDSFMGADTDTARDHYRIVRLLDSGGMGEVFEALDTRLGRRVALKTLRVATFSPETLNRLRSEARALAELDHPGIVRIHEWGTRLGLPYLAMEYLEGETLSRRLKRGPLPPSQAATLIARIARAIDYAHRRGILHRDLKPSNIFLVPAPAPQIPDAPACQPKVIDFGLSKWEETPSGITHAGTLVGTPAYMAPEQAQEGQKLVGPRSDIYSLGAVLYQCLTGQPPFPSDSVTNTLQMVLHAEPPNPRFFNRAIPRDLETVCLKCLRKEPAARYLTAADLADDLERFLANRPIQARPAAPLEKAWRWAARNRRLAAALAAVALLLVALLALASGFAWREANLRAVADAEATRAGALLEETLQGHQRAANDMLKISFLLRAATGRPVETTTAAIRATLLENSKKVVDDFRRHPELADRYPDWLVEILFARVMLCREAGDHTAESQAAAQALEILARQQDPPRKLLHMELDMAVSLGGEWLKAGQDKQAIELWQSVWNHRLQLPADRLMATPLLAGLMENLANSLAEALRHQAKDPEAADAVTRQLADLKARSQPR